ncbi:hypothetical protein ACTXT7_016726, partial [Hymenolepis weldensis]
MANMRDSDLIISDDKFMIMRRKMPASMNQSAQFGIQMNTSVEKKSSSPFQRSRSWQFTRQCPIKQNRCKKRRE